MWTEGGGTRERRTGQTDRGEAEKTFADWLVSRRERPTGKRRPDDTLVTDLLAAYAEEHGPDLEGTSKNSQIDLFGEPQPVEKHRYRFGQKGVFRGAPRACCAISESPSIL